MVVLKFPNLYLAQVKKHERARLFVTIVPNNPQDHFDITG